MKPSFTPGPWHVELDVHVLDKARTGVADCRDRWDGENYALKSSAEANARLISHSPEMYEVLLDCERNMIISTKADMARLDRIREIIEWIGDQP